jgi:putative flippase GtrA
MNIEKKKETIRIVKFFLFSVSAGVIEMSTFALLNELTEWTYWPCYLIALAISVLWNFTLNRNFTFQSASNVPVAMIKVAIFYCIFTPVTTLLGNYLAEDLRWNEYLVTAINMGLNLTTEYLYDRFFVFGKTIDTNNRAERNQLNKRKELKSLKNK